MAVELLAQTLYRIELCSGEARCWRYLGEDGRGQRWWRDEATGMEFNEAGLMYAWQIVGTAALPLTGPATKPV